MSNCAQLCPYADENEECFGDCQTIKPELKTLTDKDVESASWQLHILELNDVE